MMLKEQFIVSLEKVTKDFYSFWVEGHNMYPSQFPDEMSLSDWFYQFSMYAEDKMDES